MEQAIKNISQHVVVCGYGRMSRAMVRDFLDSGTAVVVIDNNPERLALAKDDGC
jgi:voltage-gated potassium channel Kch